MLMQFPLAHHDELLGSILARFVQRQGVQDDKVALNLLFGSRVIVPSALLQGHIEQLLVHAGHIWKIDSETIIQNHTIHPLFTPFVGNAVSKQLHCDLKNTQKNHSVLRSGINASNLKWPTFFKVCPKCVQVQVENQGYAYWQRLFQIPGVECCPEHGITLLNTSMLLQPHRRHRFVGAEGLNLPHGLLYENAAPLKIKLASTVEELLCVRHDAQPDINQWSYFYKNIAHKRGFVSGKNIDHRRIAQLVTEIWGQEFLKTYGVSISGANNWLISMFRKHRGPFSFLQHLVCLIAVLGKDFNIGNAINNAAGLNVPKNSKQNHMSSKAEQRSEEYRAEWLSLGAKLITLKEIRLTKEGARLYSWLYRFDNYWLKQNLPTKMKRGKETRIDWKKRDIEIAKKLLAVEKLYFDDLEGSRRSKAWYSNKVNCRSLLDKKLKKLPLCKRFFMKYSESVDEYQTRRLAQVVVSSIQQGNSGYREHELRRKTSLSMERSRPAAERIIKHELEAWQGHKIFAQRFNAASL